MKLATLAVAGLAAMTGTAFAQYIPRPVVPIGPMPPEGVFEMVRRMGLEPVGPPMRNGPFYLQRAADYYGKPLRVVVDASRAQIVSVEPIGGPPMFHHGPYASAGAPYWRRPYRYGMPDDDFAPPHSVLAPYGQPPQGGLPPATQPRPTTKSAAVTPSRPPVPRKRPSSAPQETAGSVEPLKAEPQPTAQAAPAAKPAAAPMPAKPAEPEMTPVAPLD